MISPRVGFLGAFAVALVFGNACGEHDGVGIGAGGTSAGTGAGGGSRSGGANSGGANSGGVVDGGAGAGGARESGGAGLGGTTVAGGGSGGHGGEAWVSACRCSDSEWTPTCTIPIEQYCSSETSMPCQAPLNQVRKTMRSLLDADAAPVYAECSDGTARFDSSWGGENAETLVFDMATGALTYVRADGYISGSCGGGRSLCWDPKSGEVFESSDRCAYPLDVLTLTGGTPSVSSDCRRCRVLTEGSGNWGAAGAAGAGGASSGGNDSLPWCVVDADGLVALPAR